MKSKNDIAERKYNKIFLFIIIAAALLAFLVISSYFWKFDGELSTVNGDWGTFGDFIGGTLNPIFGFMGLLAILYTLKIQVEEMDLTRKELEKSADALKDQTKNQEKQLFENTFFQLLSLHNEITQSISFKPSREEPTLTGRKAILAYTNNFLNEDYNSAKLHIFEDPSNFDVRIRDKFHSKPDETKDLRKRYMEYHEHVHNEIGHYFRNIYQILNFIDKYEPNAKNEGENYANKKIYSNLLRSQLSSDELILLFINCVSDIGKEKFLPLVNKYEFFEHLPSYEYLKNLSKVYSTKAFGKNHDWLEFHKESIAKT